MRFWMIFWSLVVLLLGVFVIVNWSVLTAQTSLNLIVAQVAAPLGLVMLGAMAGLALLFLIFLVWLETKALIQTGFRRASSTGEPAVQAATAAQKDLERQLGDFRAEMSASLRQVMARMERLEHQATGAGRSTSEST